MTPDQTLFLWKLAAGVGWTVAGSLLWTLLLTERTVRWQRKRLAELMKETSLQGIEIYRLRMQRDEFDRQ